MNRVLVLFTGIFLMGLVLGNANLTTMIVEPNPDYESSGFSVMSLDEDRYGVFELSDSEIEELSSDPSLVVREPYWFSVFLDDAVVQQDASSAWDLQFEGINMTGASTSVCVIDSGVDSSHPDLAGKILAEKCFCTSSNCCPDGSAEDDDATDDHGHGTHVAGIIAAAGNLNGVATGANLVVVKAMDEAGSGSETDLIAAIDWCVDNADLYNISAISMSLGADCDSNPELCYPNVCSDKSSALQAEISAAVDKNISVVIATGNDGRNLVAWPACLPDVTRVASVDKDDSTVSSFSNVNSLVKLLGVGSNINSTLPTYSVYVNVNEGRSQDYDRMSGTSMATPMVSGAIAVLNQYLGLRDLSLNTGEVEDLFYDSGKDISGYSRIDLYSALMSFDPEVELVSPVNGNVNSSANQSFVCNVSDWDLANVSLYVWNSSGDIYYSESVDVSGDFNSSVFDLENMSLGVYSWNCLGSDSYGNLAFASENYSLTVGLISVDLVSPENGSATNEGYTEFNCSVLASGNYSLANVSFYLWNSSDVLMKNESVNISGMSNSSLFNYTFVDDDDYVWGCVAYNNNSYGEDGFNYSIEYDSVSPVISGLSSGNPGTSSATITWSTNESANSSLGIGKGSWSNSSSFRTSHSIEVSGLDDDTTYDYTVWSCDDAGNCDSGSGSFTTDESSSSSSGGGSSSSGGGGSRDQVVNVDSRRLWGGVVASLEEGDRMNFNLASGSHSLEVEEVGEDWVEVEVRSDPLVLNLNVGEEVKLNLSSRNFYDLVVRLDGVDDDEVDIYVKRIYEIIAEEVEPVEKVESEEVIEKDEGPVVVEEEDYVWDKKLVVGLIVVVIILFLIWEFFSDDWGKHEKKIIKKRVGQAHVAEKEIQKGKKIKSKKSRKKYGKKG